MRGPAPFNYSIPQRIIHWLMAALILFNLLLPDGMEHYDHVVARGQVPTPDEVASANIHAYVGIAVLALFVVRLLLRLVQGVPAAPAGETAIARLASKAVHGTFYLLFLLMPLSGAAAYYLGAGPAGGLHAGLLKLIMWVLIVLHVAAVLVHQFFWKTEVLKRMTSGTATGA